MSLHYCSLHQRLLSRRYQRWVAFAPETIDDLRGYYDLLRSMNADCAYLEVMEMSCDQCRATVRQRVRVKYRHAVPTGRSKLPKAHKEPRMRKKCVSCGILMDVLCTNPVCDGHHNESVGEVCLYCATNEREKTLFCRELSTPFFSSLGDIGHGED
jgi:hypothetical protein